MNESSRNRAEDKGPCRLDLRVYIGWPLLVEVDLWLEIERDTSTHCDFVSLRFMELNSLAGADRSSILILVTEHGVVDNLVDRNSLLIIQSISRHDRSTRDITL